jgi:outer membrane protein insertion porin family
LIVACAALLSLPLVARAAGDVVADVRFEGLTTLSNAYMNSVVRTKPGAPVDADLIDEDVTRLLATGKFSTVDAETVSAPNGAVVTFRVVERPRITDVRFVGNRKYSDSRLRKEVPLQPGDPLDTFRVREGADNILLLYRGAGYGQASVAYDEQLLRSTGELLYTVEEGPRIKIEEVIFEGNDNIAKGELNKRIQSKSAIWIFRDGKFDEDTVEADAATIQNYYRDQGYLDARVSYELDFSADQEELTVTFIIVEGTRYAVERIDFEGNTVYGDAELSAILPLEVNAPILQRKLDNAVKAIQDHYGANGYIYARVRPVRVFSETPGLVDITFEVTEGDQYHVGRIVVRGNERTKDKVVRREVHLFPEEILDITEARAAEERLRATQLFSLSTVAAVGSQPNVRDLLVTVDEGRKAGDFLFGFGVTSNSGVVGSIVLDLKNFDLYDTPRTLGEFLRLRSFYGAGQRLRIEAQPGTELNRFRIDFTEPYLMDKPTRFDFSAYFFERGRESYNERRVGANVSFGRRLKWERLKDWYGELAFRVEDVLVDNIELEAPRDARDSEGHTLLTSVKASLIRDRTDSRMLPTTGDRWRFAYEQFGILGGEFFGKLSGGYTRHFTLYTDELERKQVLSLKGTASYVVGDAPLFERYYGGGIGSIRGFQFRGVSPRQGLDDDPIGGEFMLLCSTEYSFPVYGEFLRGLVFTDMGTVERNVEIRDWRVAIGTGLRMQIEFFGPVPLEFDVAVPVIKDQDDEDQIFSFFIGATF